MADISQLELNNVTYDICDAVARDAIDTNTYLLKGGTALSSSDDFNTLLTPGIYYTPGSSSMPQHGPVDNNGDPISICGKIIVEIPHGVPTSNIRGQTIIGYGNKTIYYRKYESNTWTAWYRTPTLSTTSAAANKFLATPNGSTGFPNYRSIVAADLPDLSDTYLPLNGGGTITGGSVTLNGYAFYLKSTVLDRDVPKSNDTLGCYTYRKDKNNKTLGTMHIVQSPSGNVDHEITVYNASGAYNSLSVGIKADGTSFYNFKDGQAAIDTLATGAALGANALTGNEYILAGSVNASGVVDNTTFRRRSLSKVWEYIRDKGADSRYVKLSGSVSTSTQYIKTSTIDRTKNTNPTSEIYSNGLTLTDKNGNRIALIRVTEQTDGNMVLQLGAYRMNNASTQAEVYNMLQILISKTGDRSYIVSSPAAFRDGIGLTTTVANKVWAGPTATATTAAASFRSLVPNDIPALPGSKITSGTLNSSLLSKCIKISTMTTNAFTLNAGAYVAKSLTVTVDGWDFMGFVSVNTNHNGSIAITGINRNSLTEGSIAIRNVSTTNFTDVKITAVGLYVLPNMYA